jgi:translin
LLEELVNRAAEELRLREKAVDVVMDGARRARVLSKQAIIKTHNGDLADSNERLTEASRLIHEVSEIISGYPDLGRFDQVNAAMEEYSEARILYTLNDTGAYPRPEDVGVSIRVYLMGLADVPGELRRQALDALRKGEMGLAEERLETMEEIYLNLVSMVEAPMLRGLRRKMDIARGVIERTRSEVTAEAGRRRLDESVRKLSERLL